MQKENIKSYDEFIKLNRIKINKILSVVVWILIIAGPAIYIGVISGYFPNTEYTTCIWISVVIFLIAISYSILLKKKPDTRISAGILVGFDFLLVFMAINRISLRASWALVPLLSILFCDKRIFTVVTIINYIFALATTWYTAPYYVSTHTAFNSATSYFIGAMSGLTIEMLVAFIVGYAIVSLSNDYYRRIYYQYEELSEIEKREKEKMDILDSMAEIYDNVNLISFIDNTEMSLRDNELKKISIDMNNQTHTQMNQKLMKELDEKYLDKFLEFTNITTVADRLINKKIISKDFVNKNTGWFRAQYISVEADENARPTTVIYTIRNVNEERQKEEYLTHLSLTDELTGLYNRRCYEEDIKKYLKEGLDEDFVIFSIDVNGLKKVNDTLGHAAGDDLLKGASETLKKVVNEGRAYRTGGDEFMLIENCKDPENIRKQIADLAKSWKGELVDSLSMSVGYCAYKDHKNSTINELEVIADSDMYQEKERYYLDNNIDRRKH